MSGQGILSGNEILKQVREGRITIDPLSENRLNPGSYDVLLGPTLGVYSAVVDPNFTFREYNPHTKRQGIPGERLRLRHDYTGSFFDPEPGVNCLDATQPNEVATYTVPPGQKFVLKPGIGYLGHTMERVHTDHYVPIIDGKSSLGRLFVFIHATAGFGDPGFNGQFTLEIRVDHPTIIMPGMRIGQVRFQTLVGDPKLYDGHYKGATATGPVGSRAYEQVQEDGLTTSTP